MEKAVITKNTLLKALKITTAFLAVFIVLSSCEKDKDETVIMNDNYYVKYVIKGTGAYGRFSNWTATTPEGTYTNNGYQTRSWNQTYGSVNRVLGAKFKWEII